MDDWRRPGPIFVPGPGTQVEFIARPGVMPKTFTVLGQPHTVEEVPVGESMFNGAPVSCVGATDVNEQRVRIRVVGKGGLSVAQAADTFFHEFLHSVVYTAGLRAPLFDHDHAQEERMISVLAPQLLAALRENPEVLMYLTGAYEPLYQVTGEVMPAKTSDTVVE